MKRENSCQNVLRIKIEAAQRQPVYHNALNRQPFHVDLGIWSRNDLYFVHPSIHKIKPLRFGRFCCNDKWLKPFIANFLLILCKINNRSSNTCCGKYYLWICKSDSNLGGLKKFVMSNITSIPALK